jgi:hypothetical protein
MPRGRSSWLTRSVGLALARSAFRRCLAVHGTRGEAVMGTVISRPVPAAGEWAARLSRPSVEVLMLGDHVVVREDGELVAAGECRPDGATPEPGGTDGNRNDRS